MKLLFVSNLFPNATEPVRGVFNAQQVAALSKLCKVTVIAPTNQAMADENRADVRVIHPRFFHVPVLSRSFNGRLFARAIEPVIRGERFDVALVSWAYPDAYGVMLVAEKLNFPFATAVLGSDVNVLFENPTRKQQILRALRASRVVFAKSKALQSHLAAEGVESVIDYNGIDREKFQRRDRVEACRQLGLDPKRRRVLYVGNLLPVKGPTVLARAAERLQDTEVVFVGSGPEKIAACRCVGTRPHEEIPLWMNASDVLCLPSLNEGLPNVALEAMACGLPVVASNVGGLPEIVQEGVNGFLVAPSDSNALAEALRQAFDTKWDHDAIRASVSQFDWDVNARALLRVLEKIVCN
ncbi:MAG TPA: glycosyltransferase [Verrucomicrobiae bacterium]|nr:glycosyltransferase [Verrucomicrobiae bacterium]